MKLYRLLFFITILLFAALLLVTCNTFSGPYGSNGGSSGEYSHTRNAGRSANDFLSGANFTDLVIEIDYMEGYEPNRRALDSLQAFLERRLNKTSVTLLQPTRIEALGQEAYSASQVRSLEEEHRNEFSEGNTLVAYMIFLDGEYDQSNVLGIAYYNTSNAFFGAAYDQASGGIGQVSRFKIEAISFRHEFGHLFGLVGIPNSGTDMQTEHKDEDHGNHCDNDRCLMYYAMESTDLFGQFVGEEVPTFDQNCIDDLQANGGK